MIRALLKTRQNTTKKSTEPRLEPFTKWNKMGLIHSKKRWSYIHCSMTQERKEALKQVQTINVIKNVKDKRK
jgi:hypothetical protein